MYDLSKKKRIVIKVGTSTLAHGTGNLNVRRTAELVRVFSDIKNSGAEIIFVTSGAVGVGAGRLGLIAKPREVILKQACAAVGQPALMSFYDGEFAKWGHTTAQLLVTRDVFENKLRCENVKNTIKTLLEAKVTPIENANDCVSIEQLDFDENDTLSAMVATVAGADLLVLLTDVDGLYDQNPAKGGAKLLTDVDKITDELLAACSGVGSDFGSGGMKTKLEAAQIALKGGIPTVIMNGGDPDALYLLFENKAKCTVIHN